VEEVRGALMFKFKELVDSKYVKESDEFILQIVP